jgi:uncharacterized Zn finger protein
MTSQELLDRKNQLEKEFRNAQKQVAKRAKEIFQDLFKPIFDKYPKLENFAWRQYTQYFNDGDELNFYVHTDSCSLDINGTYCEDTDENEYNDWIAKASTEIEKTLNNFKDDDYELFFGDHKQVTVYKDRVEIEDYTDHD